MLCATFSPKLDAVETDEVGLSIAFPDKQSGCAGKKAESKITDDTNVHVRELDFVFLSSSSSPHLPPSLARTAQHFCTELIVIVVDPSTTHFFI